LGQWAYLGLVGLPSGLWDMHYTTAEKSLEKKPPYSPKSIERYRKAARLGELLPEEDGRLARTYHDLGVLLWLTGRPNEARVYIWRAAEIFERVDGPNATWTGVLCERKAELELLRGRKNKALPLLRRAEAILVRTQGNFDPMALRAISLLAIHLKDRERAERALLWSGSSRVPLDALTRLQLQKLTNINP
jgi:hypothetical protein